MQNKTNKNIKSSNVLAKEFIKWRTDCNNADDYFKELMKANTYLKEQICKHLQLRMSGSEIEWDMLKNMFKDKVEIEINKSSVLVKKEEDFFEVLNQINHIEMVVAAYYLRDQNNLVDYGELINCHPAQSSSNNHSDLEFEYVSIEAYGGKNENALRKKINKFLKEKKEKSKYFIFDESLFTSSNVFQNFLEKKSILNIAHAEGAVLVKLPKGN